MQAGIPLESLGWRYNKGWEVRMAWIEDDVTFEWCARFARHNERHGAPRIEPCVCDASTCYEVITIPPSKRVRLRLADAQASWNDNRDVHARWQPPDAGMRELLNERAAKTQ